MPGAGFPVEAGSVAGNWTSETIENEVSVHAERKCSRSAKVAVYGAGLVTPRPEEFSSAHFVCPYGTEFETGET